MTIVTENGERESDTRELIRNARALLDMMVRSGWRELNMTQPHGRTRISASGIVQTESALPLLPATMPTRNIVAPHVATISWIAPVGTRLSTGMTAVRFAVLDETYEVTTPNAACVTEVLALAGDLVEFDQVILRIA